VNERDSERGVGQVLHLRPDVRVAASEVTTSSALFTILWNALADILGTAAGATLLRRAAHRAVNRVPELAALGITRQRLEYRYELPAAWKGSGPGEGLRELTRELWILLTDLTGNVVTGRLEQIPELRDNGLPPPAAEERR
jgi:hypothetical protein